MMKTKIYAALLTVAAMLTGCGLGTIEYAGESFGLKKPVKTCASSHGTIIW